MASFKHLYAQQRGIARPILLLVLVAVLAVAVAGGVSAVLLVQGDETHPNEETAKFLPDDTEIYFSLNPNPPKDGLGDSP